jgi:hypothetical protein
MHLIEIASYHDHGPNRVSRIHFVVADSVDPAQRPEWIDAQFLVDAPIGLHGGVLRRKVLERARDVLDQLIKGLPSPTDPAG